MADTKISALTAASLPLAGTEVLPIVQSGTTVKVAVDNLTAKNVRSNATTGILQVAGPAAASTRVMTVPDANFTAARTDAAQTFTGTQTFSSGPVGVNGSVTLGPSLGTDSKSGGTFMGFASWAQNVTIVAIDYQYIQNVTDVVVEALQYQVGGAGAVTFATFTGTAAGTRTGTWTGSVSVTAGTRFFVGVTSTNNGNQVNCNYVIRYVTA
jgi:hypothetical protein